MQRHSSKMSLSFMFMVAVYCDGACAIGEVANKRHYDNIYLCDVNVNIEKNVKKGIASLNKKTITYMMFRNSIRLLNSLKRDQRNCQSTLKTHTRIHSHLQRERNAEDTKQK